MKLKAYILGALCKWRVNWNTARKEERTNYDEDEDIDQHLYWTKVLDFPEATPGMIR